MRFNISLPGWASPFGDKGSSKAVSVYVSGGGAAVATVSEIEGSEKAQSAEGETESQFCARLRIDHIANVGQAGVTIAEQAKQLGVLGSACNLVLAPEFYRITLIERPDVNAEELAAAARWKIQEHLDYPVTEAVVDVFELPMAASRDRPMVFAVATKASLLKSIVQQVIAAGLTVRCIDISELSLRNLTYSLYPEPDQGVALLRLTSNSGVINLSRGDELFLSRRINGVPSTFSADAWGDFKERLLLQVQRSIDYYESALSQPPCSALMVAATHGWQAATVAYLEDALPVPVLNITDALSTQYCMDLYNPDEQNIVWDSLAVEQVDAICAALPALGGALRYSPAIEKAA